MPPPVRQRVSDIRASFELKKDPPPTAGQPSQLRALSTPGGPANMSPSKRAAPAPKSVQPSIDAVLDQTPAALPTTLHPSTSKQPSWIGPKAPDRPLTPNVEAMKHTATIEFSSPGLQPPVFVGTGLSDPAWEPVEMESVKASDGEYHFSKSFTAEEGEYQYKLRLGPGDWWICDDSKPKVDDGAGNQNNLIVIVPSSLGAATIQKSEHEQSHMVDPHAAPLMPHEINSHPDHNKPAPSSVIPASMPEHEIPGPLLRHESVSPTSHEQEHSPLFRHESIASDSKHEENIEHRMSPKVIGRKAGDSFIPEEADPNDLSLERFPTDHKGIVEHLGRTHRSLQESAVSDESRSPSRSSAESAVRNGSLSLPRLVEDENEDRDAQVSKEKEEENFNAEDLSTSDLAQLGIVEPADIPAAPMTPPLTPQEQDEKELDSSPLSIREKTEKRKGEAKKRAARAQNKTLPVIAVGLAFVMALASVALAMWYIGAKNNDVTV